MKLLMISMDRKIFDKGSAVAQRQIEYAKNYEETHIIIFTDKSYEESTLGSNIFLYPTRSSSRWLYVFDALKLARFIVPKKGIGDMTCDNPFETGLVGALVKKRIPAVKLELQIHTDIGSKYFQHFTFLNRIRTIISKYTLPKADRIRVVSYRIQEYLSTFIEPSRIVVRPIAVNTDNIKNAPITTDLHKKYPQFSKIILMVSRLEPEKNIGMAIDAFKKVLKEIPNAGLVIVGSGNEESHLKSISNTSVVFEGWQTNTASYYKTCDCFLNTSWYEGYGMTLVEAKAAGAKIVSTNVGVAREMEATIVDFTSDSIAHGIIEAIK